MMHRSRLFVRALERRDVPATFTVLNANDAGADSLRGAFAAANAAAGADTIVFDPGVVGTIALTTGELLSTDNLTIVGPGSSKLTVSSGGLSRVMHNEGTGTVMLSITGLTIADGVSAGDAVGLFALDGGNILVGADDILSLNDVRVLNGTVTNGQGGGIALANNAQLTILNSTISGNKAPGTTNSVGGGVYFLGTGDLEVINSTISGNSCNDEGGGVYFYGTPLDGSIRFINSTVSGNSATANGGGVLLNTANGVMLVDHCTFADNFAGGVGGGIGVTGGNPVVRIESSAFRNNFAFSGADVSSSSLVTSAYSILNNSGAFSFADLGGNQLGVDPLLGPLQSHGGSTETHVPGVGSPAINKGRPTVGQTLDQRGALRSYGTTDVGAVEVFDPVVPSAAPVLANVTIGGGSSYAFTITYADDVGINPASTAKVSITAPAGGVTILTPTTTSIVGKSLTATYAFTPPGGTWDASDIGVYTVSVIASQVSDTDATPNSAPAGAVGAFRVSLPTTFVVNTSLDIVDPADNQLSLREVIMVANDNAGAADSITFNLGAGPQSIYLTYGQMTIDDSLNITGPGAADLTIDAGNLSRHFLIAAPGVADVTLKGMTLANGRISIGYTQQRGGSIQNWNENLTLDSMTLTGNTVSGNTRGASAVAQMAGGIMTIKNSVFTNNANQTTNTNAAANIPNGGALLINGGQLSISDSVFSNNSSTRAAGAIDAKGLTQLTILRTTIANNTAVDNAGGIRLENIPVVSIDDSTISGNSAGLSGGGIYNAGGTAASTITARNSTISGNTANSSGGGIALAGVGAADLVLRSSTIAANTANAGKGGGIARLNAAGAITVDATVIADNNNPSAADVSSSTLVNVNDSAIGSAAGFTLTGANNLPFGAYMKLGPLADNGGPTLTHRPLSGSPLRDAGPATSALTNDQRGLPRLIDSRVDIGAVESSDPAPTAAAGTTNVALPGGPNYTFIVRFADGQTSIKVATVLLAQLEVAGPNNFKVTPTYVSVDDGSDGTPRTATFKFAVPGGTWDAGENGTYTVSILPNQVFDNDIPSNAVPDGLIGTFTVALPSALIVNTTADTIDDTDGKLSLREAIVIANAAAPTADTITFDPIVFATAQTIAMTFSSDQTQNQFSITDTVSIIGPAARVTLDGMDVSRHFLINGPGTLQVNLSNLILTNGQTYGGLLSTRGGSIQIEDENVTITNTDITDNIANARAGAIAVQITSQLTLDHVKLINNSLSLAASAAGGIYFNAGDLKILHSEISNNTSTGLAGGIWAVAGTLVVTDSTIANNIAAGRGGGICGGTGGTSTITLSSVAVTRSTISGNVSTGDGGGCYFRVPSGIANFVFENSTVSGNTASTRGGGIANAYWNQTTGGSFILRNSTIFANTANGTAGGGMRFTAGGSGTITVVSSIVFGNVNAASPDIAASTVEVNTSIIGNATGFTFSDKGGNLPFGTDPLLDVLANNGGPTFTHALLTGSPAINAGSNTIMLTTDQRGAGYKRDFGQTDMGAFEVQPAPMPAKIVGAVVINGGAAQRSRVTTLRINFDSSVTFTDVSQAFQLNRVSGGNGSVTLNSVPDSSGMFVTMTFTGGTVDGKSSTYSLQDGRYVLTIVASQFAGAGFDGNGDGTAGDNYISPTAVNSPPTTPPTGIFRLFGDADGNGQINGADFLQFRLNFLQPSAVFDFDGSGTVDGTDFLQFRLRFLQTIP